MTTDETPSLRDVAGAQENSEDHARCAKCNATHWIVVSIAAQKKLDDLINLNLEQQLEIAALRRHITELNGILESRKILIAPRH